MLLRCYPRITDWLYHVSNQSIDLRFLPIYSYGFFVAAGFISAAWIAVKMMDRRKAIGMFTPAEKKIWVGKGPDVSELVSYIVFGLLVGAKVGGMLTMREVFSNDPQHYIFSLQGNWLVGVAAAIISGGWYYYSKTKSKLAEPREEVLLIYPQDRIGDFLVIAAVLGVLGANLFNFLENPEDLKTFMDDPIGSLFSGLSVFGGLICAAGGFWAYARWHKIPVLPLFDSVAPGFIFANGMGRIGCHVSGDGDWGIINPHIKPSWFPQFLWSDDYAHNIIDAGVRMQQCAEQHCMHLPQPVYPTPVYEFMQTTTICLILVALTNRFIRKPGMLFSIFLILLGIQRYTIEQFRDISDRDLYHIFGGSFRQAELISIGMVIGGIAMFFLLRRQYENLPNSTGAATS